MKPIFTENFLSQFLSEFRASSVTGIRDITILLKSFIEELESGKLESLKEEEIKSRFITEFFGDVLGFNYGNSNEWQLREEKKTEVDGTKADAALGYFFRDKEKDDVRVIIEIKDAKKDLDTKQNRELKQTPVEQAFSYVPKMGGTCKWVIVSNIKEIRFYCSNDISMYQVFFLKDLNLEIKRNELLFLFHKDRFLRKEGVSNTELLLKRSKSFANQYNKPMHLIDKIDQCLKCFEGIGFIDPEYLATLYPFNILGEYVWHYSKNNLFTINSDFFNLLNGISIEDNEVIFDEEIKLEIETANVVDAKLKLENAFRFLNHCLIHKITAIKDYKEIESRNLKTIGFSIKHQFSFIGGNEGITKNIYISQSNKCDCIICNYRSLNFKKLLQKLKASIGNETQNTLEFAYGNYLTATNNFKTTYSIYKTIERETKGKEGKEVIYFLTKLNIKHLHNLIMDYEYSDSLEIMNDIKAIDIDKVIYDEIEFSIKKEVKDYLIDIKEDDLIYKLQDQIEEIIFEIEKLKHLYASGGTMKFGPNYSDKLCQTYYRLYNHINGNYIVYSIFKRYKLLTEKVLKGLITSYQTKEYGVIKFNEFFLTEAILHINPSNLEVLLKSIDNLSTDEGSIENLIEKLNNFTSSYVGDSLFGSTYIEPLIKEALTNYRFSDTFTNIFSNQLIILSRLEITKEQFTKSISNLVKYLKIETELSWHDIKYLCDFLLRKGHLFESSELYEILNIAINGHKFGYTKYEDLISITATVISKIHSNYLISNKTLIQLAIVRSTNENGKTSFNHLIPLLQICNQECKKHLIGAFEQTLDENFNGDFYEELLKYSDYSFENNNYFKMYVDYINKNKGNGVLKFGKQRLTDLVFINFVLLIYKLNIDFERTELLEFTNLNDFESWLLNPNKFDYKKFDANWMLDIYEPVFFNRLKTIRQINLAIDIKLITSFNSVLAEIKYTYFI